MINYLVAYLFFMYVLIIIILLHIIIVRIDKMYLYIILY